MHKRMLSILLTLSLTVICMGCGDDEEGVEKVSSTYTEEYTTDTEEELVTLNLYSQLASFNGMQTGWYADILKEKLGIEVYISCMEGDTEPDIYLFGAYSLYQEAIDNGQLLDWNSNDILENYGSYISENFQTALKYNATEYGNGNIYGIGENIAENELDHENIVYTWDIRWDIYKQLGYPEVGNLDDLFTVLSDMQTLTEQNNADSGIYAMSGWNERWGDFPAILTSSIAAYYGDTNFGLDFYDCATGEYYDCLSEDGPYIEMIRFYNKLYRAGLLDPETSDNSLDDVLNKTESGKALFSFTNYAGSIIYNTEANTAAEKVMLPLVANEAHPFANGLSSCGNNYIVAINADTKYPEKCMQLLNYLCIPESFMELNYGPEDLCWYYDENGLSCFTSLGKAAHYDYKTKILSDDSQFEKYNGQEFGSGNSELGLCMHSLDSVNPNTGERYNDEYWLSNQTDASCDTMQDWMDYTGANSSSEYMENTNYSVYVNVPYEESEKSKELTETWKKVTQDITDGTWAAIYADSDDALENAIDNMVEVAEKDGYADCIDWSDNEISSYVEEYNNLFD